MTETPSLSATLQHLGRMVLAGDVAGLSDAELVGRFAERRDEGAFTALIRRYGMVVLGVCRRVLRHEQDAEDAFQATFLVLARNAASLRRAETVGNWLYGVAYNVARKSKALRHRRELKERNAAVRHSSEVAPAAPDDLRQVIDGELHALPDKYRAAVVLCDLRGLTIREAAAEVGCPPKTLGTRLTRGRSLLARRLMRRGVTVTAGLTIAALATEAIAPPSLMASTAHVAISFAAGNLAHAAVPPAVEALTKGVSNVMLSRSLKYVVVLACGVLLVAGVGAAHLTGPVASPSPSVVAGEDSVPAGGQVPPAKPKSGRPLSHLDYIHRFLVRLLGLGDVGQQVVQVSGEKDTPSLSGTWTRKEGELKFEFVDKDIMKIFPHGENPVLIIVCQYSVEKDGRVKARITELEGKDQAKEKAKELVPVGLEFSFKWNVKDGVGTLGDLKGEKADILKSHLEGEYAEKK